MTVYAGGAPSKNIQKHINEITAKNPDVMTAIKTVNSGWTDLQVEKYMADLVLQGYKGGNLNTRINNDNKIVVYSGNTYLSYDVGKYAQWVGSQTINDFLTQLYKSYSEITGRKEEWKSQSKQGLGLRKTILTSGRGIQQSPELALSRLKSKLGA